jgi:hypothetical protein
VVTSLPHIVELGPPETSRVYRLRAPTFGEVGAMVARQAGRPAPSDAIFVEALEEAIGAADLPKDKKEKLVSAIHAAEDAADAVESLYAVHGPDRAGWSAEVQQEIVAAEREYRAAQKGRARAEWAVRDVPALAELRRHQGEVGRREQVEMILLCLDGDPAILDAEAVAAMPAGDALAVYQRAVAITRPGKAAEKN